MSIEEEWDGRWLGATEEQVDPAGEVETALVSGWRVGDYVWFIKIYRRDWLVLSSGSRAKGDEVLESEDLWLPGEKPLNLLYAGRIVGQRLAGHWVLSGSRAEPTRWWTGSFTADCVEGTLRSDRRPAYTDRS